jgi:chromosome segregation ATPase
MAGVLTREQAEAAVSAAVAERDTIRASLLELDRSLGKQLLAAPNAIGDTRRRWNGAAVDLTMLWEVFEAYSATVDRAAAIHARAHRGGDGLAEVTAVLTGPSVRLAAASSPVTSRNLTGTADTWLTLAAAVQDMRSIFDSVADVVLAAEDVWTDAADRLRQADADLAEAKRRADGFADEELTRMLATAEADLGRLRGVLNSDPMALSQRDHLDAARLERLQQQTGAISARASELARLHDGAGRQIAAATAAVADARDAWQEAAAVQERAAARIAAALAPLPDTGRLADRVAALGELSAAGRWTRLASELADLERQAASAQRQCRTAQQEAAALLDRRDELRGLLDGYRARAARFGTSNPDLRARYDEARELLWTRPCDLAVSAAAVTAYQQAVLALSTPGRRS